MLNGEVVIFIGRESDNLEAERLAVRKPNSGLVRMLSAAEVEEVPFFWQADYLKFEKLVVEVGNNNAALKRIGIVQELETTGELGYMYEGQFYKVPTQNEIFELLYPNLEVLDTKASQGFKLPLLVPYLYPVNDYLKLVNDCFAEYSDGSLLRESILETSPISYPLDKPAIIAPSDLTNGLLYHPKGFFSIDKGVNRNTFLKELDSKGFGIVLIEDFISAPAYSSSRKYGGRQQIGSVIYVGDGIKDGRLGFDPSLPEYFAESGMTVPDWLTMVSYYLVTGSAPLHESSEYSNLLLLGNSYRGNDTFCVTFSRLHGQNGYRLGRFKKVGRWVGGDGTDRVLRNVVRAS